MIVGYHVIFAAYGFWLPNDPRGSWSKFVGSLDLYYAAGAATTTTDPRSLARKSHDRQKRLAGKAALKHRPVQFTGVQARAIGRGFSQYLLQSDDPVWACAIMPDHVHFVIGRSHLQVEKLVIQLKAAATRQLVEEDLHPFSTGADTQDRSSKCFVRGQRIVFLEPGDVRRAIK